MRFNVRKKISYTFEEIYEFELNHEIEYVGIYFSHRNDIEDVWGYDWSLMFNNDKEKALENLRKTYNYEDYNEYEWLSEPFNSQYEAIMKKYNPTCNKTKDGKTYLTGTFGGHIKLSEPKVSKEEIMDVLMIIVKNKEIRF